MNRRGIGRKDEEEQNERKEQNDEGLTEGECNKKEQKIKMRKKTDTNSEIIELISRKSNYTHTDTHHHSTQGNHRLLAT